MNYDKLQALFTDGTSNYLSPTEPKPGDEVTIKFRTGHKSATSVVLVAGEERLPMTLGLFNRNVKGFDYYSVKKTMTEDTFRYYFLVTIDGREIIYDARGVVEETREDMMFRIHPGFSTPDWAKGGIFYQIYVDRFNNGDKSNDVLTDEYHYINGHSISKEWNEKIDTGLLEHYGGDLQGVIDKLDYLKKLGVEVLYLNPIFISPSNHKYDTADFDHIDPHFGVIVNDEGELLEKDASDNTKATRFIKRVSDAENLAASDALFAKLTEEAHKRGMKVILDGVFNHCGSFNKWMDAEKIYEKAEGYEKGAYVSEDSPYHDYFIWKEGGKWPYNSNYEAWWDYETLPKLNYNSSTLYDYICGIGAKWVSAPYNADGWRLDVAADLGPDSETNHRFWADFRKSVKEANPNAIILAEHYGDASSWLQGNEWDTVMNYDAFMEPLTWFLTGMEKHSDEYKEELVADKDAFWKSMKECSARFSTPSLLTAMNELSNHDHSRFLTRTTRKVGRVEELGIDAASEGTDKAVMREAVTVQMTWPGAPTLYYGDEAGVCGFTDPDNRRVYPWGSEDKELLGFHQAAIALHKKRKELRTGSLIPLSSPIGVIAYGRRLGKKVTLTLVNNMPVDMEVKLPVWMLGIGVGRKYRQRLITDSEGYKTKGRSLKDKDGILTVIVPKTGGIVLCN